MNLILSLWVDQILHYSNECHSAIWLATPSPPSLPLTLTGSYHSSRETFLTWHTRWMTTGWREDWTGGRASFQGATSRCVCVCVCVCVCMHTCMCVCVCVHACMACVHWMCFCQYMVLIVIPEWSRDLQEVHARVCVHLCEFVTTWNFLVYRCWHVRKWGRYWLPGMRRTISKHEHCMTLEEKQRGN